MSKRLQPQDGRAIDLVLDKAKRSHPSEVTYAAPDEAVLSRVEPVQKVLNLLAQWPAEEPPADLVARTLARIDGAMPGNGLSQSSHINPFGPTLEH